VEKQTIVVNHQQVEAEVLLPVSSNELWSEWLLPDGTVYRARPCAVKFFKGIVEGQPAYIAVLHQMTDVVPAKPSGPTGG
jgi:hypothetical protein